MRNEEMIRDFDLRRLRVRLALMSIPIGLISGLFAVAYRYTLSRIDVLRGILLQKPLEQAGWLLLFFLVSALIMHRLLIWAPYSGGSGIPQIRAELLGKIEMESGPTILSKFLGGSLGDFAGLTLGREGPSIQIGGMAAKVFTRIFHTTPMESRYLITAGAASGLAAAFNAPVSGALFAMEEVHKSLSHLFLIPCLVASLVANAISFSLLGFEPAFSFAIPASLPVALIGHVVLVGIVGGLLGALFSQGLLFFTKEMKALPVPRFIVIFLIMAALFFVGRMEPLFLGGGHALIEQMARGTTTLTPLLLILLVRLLFVWFSYGSGAQGGIFLPVLTLGAAIGTLLFSLFVSYTGLDSGYLHNFIYLGMVAVLTGVVQAPLMSILLVTEMSGSITLLLSVTACAVVAFLTARLCQSGPIYESLFDLSFGELQKGGNAHHGAADENITAHYFLVPNEAFYVGEPLSALSLPPSTLITLVVREESRFSPTGSTVLQGGDELMVLCPESEFSEVTMYFNGDLSVLGE